MIRELTRIKNRVSQYADIVPILQQYLQHNKCDNLQTGGSNNALKPWRNITSDHTILETVQGMKIDFTEMPNSLLLKKNTVSPCPHEEGEIISNIFLRPKKDGPYRLILNLKNLNQFAEYKHFKMDSLHTILRLMKKGCHMASLDIKDAYYTIPVDETHQKYLKFQWETQLYILLHLPPNGVGPCPRKFTKVLKPP